MSGWTLVDIHPTKGRTFRRPLGVLECCFLWDGLLDGTEDGLQHYELSLSNGSQDAHLFSEANIIKAWLSTKRRYPLVGVTVRGMDGEPLQLKLNTNSEADIGTGFTSEPHFVVLEHDLAVLCPQEIVFGQVTSAEDARRKAVAIARGPRPLLEEPLVQLHVFRETDSERTNILHLMILMAHCVTDGMANRTIVRCLLDTLARGEGTEPTQIALEDRLAMAIPWVDLKPEHLRSFGPARQRWRRAAGMVILQLREAKRRGGHTLPCRLTRSTWHTAARPGLVHTSLTHSQTAAVISNCRLHDITFGNAFLALAQVAMTRVLYRRYLRGEIPEEEWEYRKKQPHINGGPFSLRRYLDKAWFEKGGGGEFVPLIGLFTYQLPFMTLGATKGRYQRILSDGAPPFSDLLTFGRFLHRARLVKKQAAAFFGHPLFFEIEQANHLAYAEHTQRCALKWMQRTNTANDHARHEAEEEDKVLAVTDTPTRWAHGGSSLGNLDLISPSEYPLPSTHPLSPHSLVPHPVKAGYVTPSTSLLPGFEADAAPTIIVQNSRVHLHTRPGELYLGAVTWRGKMDMYIHYDGNVFEEGVVREWLDEVSDAVLWYLGLAP